MSKLTKKTTATRTLLLGSDGASTFVYVYVDADSNPDALSVLNGVTNVTAADILFG